MKLYKLTDQNDRTYGGCQWGENITVETSGTGGLCGPGFTHWYTHPLLAVLLNPLHGDFHLASAHLWEGEGVVAEDDYGLKVGCTKATTVKRIPLPKIALRHRTTFAILCARKIEYSKEWNRWARKWLSGKDRSSESAQRAAGCAVSYVANSAARAAISTEAREDLAAEAAVWASRKTHIDLIALAKRACRNKKDSGK